MRAGLARLNHPALIGVLLFGVALLPRLYRLDAQSLWLDEGSTWQLIQADWATLLGDLFSPAAAYPLYHVLLKLWVSLAGDSEFALRLPSALAGAAAIPLLWLATRELGGARWSSAAAVALALISPFALWYSQEAKVYSLVLLQSVALTWLTLRASHTPTRSAWLWVIGVALLGLFLHRLTALLSCGAIWAAALSLPLPRPWRWGGIAAAALGSLGLVAALARGLGSDRAATGAYIPADPLSALGLTFSRFSLDRWPGDAPWWWLLPAAALTIWGGAELVLQLRRQPRPEMLAFTALLIAPLAIFCAQLIFTRLYEARYLIGSFPVWLLLLALPLSRPLPTRWLAALLLGGSLGVSGAALSQAPLGLFSGAPVKEQYREALRELAQRVHPDDLVILHPSYLRPLYNYYMPRLLRDPAPEPVSFGDFKQGQEAFGPREWDTQRLATFADRERSLLLIAPDHARTVDPPLQAGDKYGLVGLYFQYSLDQRAWPCGMWGFVGVDVLCQEAPEAYISGRVITPSVPLDVRFGSDLRLIGYSLKPNTAGPSGVYRAGGNIPLSLFFDVAQPLGADYSIFVHLCRDCDSPPPASSDGPPLGGYLPTSTWLPGKPARDDRAIHLPADLAPGRYQLLLGVYRPGDTSSNARLPISGGTILSNQRLVLAEVEIVR